MKTENCTGVEVLREVQTVFKTTTKLWQSQGKSSDGTVVVDLGYANFVDENGQRHDSADNVRLVNIIDGGRLIIPRGKEPYIKATNDDYEDPSGGIDRFMEASKTKGKR